MGFTGKDTGVACHALLQGIFLTQGSNLGLLYCSPRMPYPPGLLAPLSSLIFTDTVASRSYFTHLMDENIEASKET